MKLYGVCIMLDEWKGLLRHEAAVAMAAMIAAREAARAAAMTAAMAVVLLELRPMQPQLANATIRTTAATRSGANYAIQYPFHKHGA